MSEADWLCAGVVAGILIMGIPWNIWFYRAVKDGRYSEVKRIQEKRSEQG